jgi:hypothetical protein
LNLRQLAAPGINAVKEHWRPIVLIQACFVVFVILYFSTGVLKGLPATIDGFKAKVGEFPFTIVTIWIVSLLVPELAKFVTRQPLTKHTWKSIVTRLAYFATIGFTLVFFYNWMNEVYGTSNDVLNVARKVLTDQFVYSALFSMPVAAITFLYEDSGFRFAEMVKRLKQGEFWKRYFPLMVTCLCYFGPVTVVMYSVPLALQFPLAMCAQAAWGIIVVSVGSREDEGHAS